MTQDIQNLLFGSRTPFGASGVSYGAEFRRIEALPRRPAPVIDIGLLTQYLRLPGGTQELRPNQAACLSDAYDFGGLFGLQGTGAGKTLISLLAPTVLGAERPVLLVPASLKYKTEKIDIPFYAQHWRMHPHLKVVSNQTLQTLNSRDLLYRYMPDLLILDEAHEYRNRKAARTQRLLRYFRDYPHTKLIALSGTLTKRSIRDYWHLIKHALPTHCPLPLHWQELLEWSEALDEDVPDNKRRPAGALARFCAQGENTRQGFRRRLVETPGVVATQETSCDASLYIFEREIERVPPEVVQAFERLRTTATTPSGDELTDQMNVWRRGKELAYGFFYRWVWPNNEPDLEWLDARRAWRKFVRETLQFNRQGLDSELAVARAVQAGQYDASLYEEWMRVKDRWKPHPPREAVWVSDYLVQDAQRWLSEHTGIVWVEHDAVGNKIAQTTGLPYFGAAADEALLTFAATRQSFVASVHAHGKGKNLQNYAKALMVCCPSGGDVWEQLLARHHRPGQASDEVTCYVYQHTRELWSAFTQALKDGCYIEDSTGQRQKLNVASILRLTDLAAIGRMSGADPLWRSI